MCMALFLAGPLRAFRLFRNRCFHNGYFIKGKNMTSILDDHFSLKGKIVLVTGASSGIGAQLATASARAGADVIVAARRAEKLEALAADITNETGQKAVAISMDVSDADSVAAGYDKAEELLGTPDVVANNAGVASPRYAIEETEDNWDFVVGTNLKGAWRVATVGAQRMVKAGKPGSIINTASILGLGVGPQQGAYATSKGGVVHMTKALATEWQRFGIRVNAICPGYFKTEINEAFLETETGQKMVSASPAKRAGRLEELEAPFLMLAGDGASFVTGVALPVDGAHHSRLV